MRKIKLNCLWVKAECVSLSLSQTEFVFSASREKISSIGVFIIFALSKRSYSELTRKFIYPLKAFTTHLGLYSIVEIHLVPPTDGGQSVNRD